jgi:hypothetical protein
MAENAVGPVRLGGGAKERLLLPTAATPARTQESDLRRGRVHVDRFLPHADRPKAPSTETSARTTPIGTHLRPMHSVGRGKSPSSASPPRSHLGSKRKRFLLETWPTQPRGASRPVRVLDGRTFSAVVEFRRCGRSEQPTEWPPWVLSRM